MTTLIGLVLVILGTFGTNELLGHSIFANIFGVVLAAFVYIMLNWRN